VAEQPVIMCPGAVPHHGLVGLGCPVDCLRTVLSWHSFNPLARADDAPFAAPRTVGDVIALCAGGRLRQIRGLGRRRTSEIEAALVFAGLVVTGDPPRPQAPAKPEIRKGG
jgi:hypothetical protein